MYVCSFWLHFGDVGTNWNQFGAPETDSCHHGGLMEQHDLPKGAPECVRHFRCRGGRGGGQNVISEAPRGGQQEGGCGRAGYGKHTAF